MSLRFDHFIYAGPDLDTMIAQFAKLTGVTPAKGGRHPGLGTMNALMSLGPDIYFELLAVDPSQSLEGNMGGRINALAAPQLFFYMLTGGKLETVRDAMLKHGITADLFDASRTTPDGKTLKWRLLVPHDNPLGFAVPNCIDWLDTVNPAITSVPGCTFMSFEMGHPQPDKVRALLADLDANVPVHYADRLNFRLQIQTPKGPLYLSS